MSRWRDRIAALRPLRWLGAAAVFVLMPKCLVCLVAYVGLGAALGLKVGPEICGGSGTGFPVGAVAAVSMGLLSATAAAMVIRIERGRRKCPE